jgi:hypothetical protein
VIDLPYLTRFAVDAELFPGFESGTSEVTVTVFRIVVPRGAVTLTTNCRPAARFLLTVPRLQVTVVGPAAQLPELGVAVTKVVPVGRVSVMVTPVASFGPELKTAIV